MTIHRAAIDGIEMDCSVLHETHLKPNSGSESLMISAVGPVVDQSAGIPALNPCVENVMASRRGERELRCLLRR